jgi:IS30 family transposase
MGNHYRHLSARERLEIEMLHRAGSPVRRIAAALGRSPGTITRELRRNAVPTKHWRGPYDGMRAEALYHRRRRWDARFKLARQPDLADHVRRHLAMGWSPEQIAGRLAREHGRTIVSHESIYRFIAHRCAQKDWWNRLLPRAKHRRGRLGKRGGSLMRHIRDRVGVAERPEGANTRAEPGHWEVDLMLFARYGQAVLVAHERSTRFTVLFRQPSKAAAPVAERLLAFFASLPGPLRRSATFDNGPEFTHHHRLREHLGMATYFCDPHAPWQKGGVENAIGRLRRPLPRKSDLATIDQTRLDHLVQAYNDTPRRRLAFRTAAELFHEARTVALQP